MSASLPHIIAFLEQWAPLHLQAKWDNCGLQLGDPEKKVRHVVVALDVDQSVLDYIQTHPVDLIITHHPLFFAPIKSLSTDTPIGHIVRQFMQRDIALYSMHTNLDCTENGVSDCLARAFHCTPVYTQDMDKGLGRWVDYDPPKPLTDLIQLMPGRLVGDIHRTHVRRVGFCGGSGKSLINQLKSMDIDLFITGEIGYHDEVFCALNKLSVYVLGHKESEDVVLPEIQRQLALFDDSLEVTVL